MTSPPSPTSTRRALLIGAPAPDLAGVERDVGLIVEALVHHQFAEPEIRIVLPATREAVEAAFAQLIAATTEHDAVVVYYSGHGSGIDAPAARGQLGDDDYYRFLVLSDFEQSTQDCFRGYTNVELALQVEKLTEKTRNLALIMDCCFAGRIFREAEDSVARIEWQDTSRYRPTRFHQAKGCWATAAVRFYERLKQDPEFAPGHRHAEANPFAVQLLASSAGGKAYETEVVGSDGNRGSAGVLTAALHKHLLAVDPERTTWQDLGRLIRMTPQRAGDQRVSVEGPYRRFLFRLDERDELGGVEVDIVDGEVRLAGGRLAGLRVGDRHELARCSDQVIVGRARVDRVESFYATVETNAPSSALESRSSARPLGYASARGAVEFVGFDRKQREREQICARLEASGLLRVAQPGELELPIVARLRLDDGRLQLWSGDLSFDIAHRYEPNRAPRGALNLVDHLVDGCQRLARAAMFRRLALDCPGDLIDGWSSSFVRVEAGALGEPVAKTGAYLHEEDTVTVHVRADVPVFLSIFAIHADGCIELLSLAQGGGVELQASKNYVLGQRSFGPLIGLTLKRPSSSVLATEFALPITILTIVSERRIDLRSWEQRGIGRFVPRDPLAPAIVTRNFAQYTPAGELTRHRVEVIEFNIAKKSTATTRNRT